MDIDTAALDQPDDEVGLMAELAPIGNDEPRNRQPRHTTLGSRYFSLKRGEK